MDPVEALRENLDDPARWAVFADWLTANGDPAGELCALELQRPADRSRIIELKHQRTRGEGRWHPLDVELARAALERPDFSWFGGHLQGVWLQNPWDGSREPTLRAVLTAPCGRFVRALSLSQEYPDTIALGTLGTRGEWEWATAALVELGAPSLEELTLGTEERESLEFAEGSSMMITTDRPRTPGARIVRPSRWLGDVQPAFARLPRLRSLTLHGEGTQLSALPPTLVTLSLRSRFVRASTLRAIGATPLPRLERLMLWPGHWPDSAPHFEPPEPEAFYGGATSEVDLAPLLSARHVPKLTALEVSNSNWTAGFLTALAESPLLAQLQTLDVSNGLLDERDVEQLVRIAPRFRHLAQLVLDRHRVVDAQAQARLTAAFGPSLVLGRQFVPEPDLFARLFS